MRWPSGGCDLDRALNVDEIAAAAACTRREGTHGEQRMTTLIASITLIHVAAFVVMILIRVRRTEGAGTAGDSALITPCAVCGEPATRRSYDGLDPNEQRDPHTGRPYSINMAHYQPLCAVH